MIVFKPQKMNENVNLMKLGPGRIPPLLADDLKKTTHRPSNSAQFNSNSISFNFDDDDVDVDVGRTNFFLLLFDA